LKRTLAYAAAFAAIPQSDDFAGTTLKSFWKTMDVGQSDGGSVTVKDGKIYPIGSGADLWGTTFQCFIVYQDNITGNFRATIEVDKTPIPDHSDGWSSTGLMIASPSILQYNDTQELPAFWVAALTNNNGFEMKGTPAATSIGDSATAAAGTKPPAWVRLEKIGSTITGQYSTDGKTFANIRSPMVLKNADGSPYTGPVVFAIYVQSHDGDNMGDPILSNLVVEEIPAGTVEGTIKDASGKPISGAVVNAVGGGSATTDANGKYSMMLKAGDYTLVPGSSAADFQPVTVTVVKDQTVTKDFVGTPLPTFSLSTAAGIAKWKLFTYSDNGDAAMIAKDGTDFAAADPAFNDTGWDDVDVPGDVAGTVGTNTYFWYRAHFRMPAAFSALKDRPITITNFQIDDSDWTYLNGHLLGSMSWMWNTNRTYIIDPAWVNWDGDNVLAIKGYQGGGGAGMNVTAADGPTMFASSAYFGVLKGKMLIAGSSLPAEGATLTLTSADGKSTYTATPDAQGGYQITNMLGGSYSGTVAGRTVTGTSPTTLAVDVPGGKVTTAPDLQVSYAPFKIEKPDAAISDDFSASTLNAKWTATDLGTTDAGDQSISNGVLVIHADGADFWTGGDNGRFIYQKGITGDFQATLHVLNVPDTDGWSKVGIMARESTDPMSVHAFVCATRDNGESLQGRTSANPEANFNVNAGTFTQGTGYYVKLLRRGNHIEGYKSPDGVNSIFIAEYDSPNLPKTVLLGIGVTSHSAGNVGEAKVDDFVFSSQLPGPVTPPPPAVVKGDLSGDGKVLVNDAVLALQFAVGLKTPTADQLAAGDLNGDGKITINEVTLILQAAVGLRTL
jgi:hypothetical protein